MSIQLSFFEGDKKVVSLATEQANGHTPAHFMCPACERTHMGPFAPLSSALIFAEAFHAWISRRVMKHATQTSNARYISERTEWDYHQYFRALNKFFIGMRLADIKAEHLSAYQFARAFNEEHRWDHPCGANRIRKEIGMLIRILRAAHLWKEKEGGGRQREEDEFQLVSLVERDIQRALTPEEQYHWLEVAGSKNDWQFIYQYSIAAFQTCMSTNELRGLRLSDVRLDQRVVNVRWASAKNKYRIRTIPLETQESIWAFESLAYRAQTLGAGAPHHFLFPFGGRGGYSYDPSRPMGDTGLRKRWDQVREESGLDWFRPYDTRHSGLTRLAEAGVPIAVIETYSGHMTDRMRQHYTQISMMSKRKAAAATWSGTVPKPALVTVTAPETWAECHGGAAISRMNHAS
jgi:integrase